METYRCSRCEIDKPLSLFSQADGRRKGTRCKACQSALRQPDRDARSARRAARPKPVRDRDLTEKRCNVCGLVKPVGDFYWNQRKWPRDCKTCRLERLKKQRRLDPEGVRSAERKKRANQSDASRLRGNAGSLAWAKRYPQKAQEKCARRKARLLGVGVVERVDRGAIIARDNSTCYLCGTVLGLRAITLDHVVPLVAGGHHSAANLRVACKPCNSSKADLSLEDYLASRARSA